MAPLAYLPPASVSRFERQTSTASALILPLLSASWNSSPLRLYCLRSSCCSATPRSWNCSSSSPCSLPLAMHLTVSSYKPLQLSSRCAANICQPARSIYNLVALTPKAVKRLALSISSVPVNGVAAPSCCSSWMICFACCTLPVSV
jgi:hypothetical protein